jgi:hypothetical protein
MAGLITFCCLRGRFNPKLGYFDKIKEVQIYIQVQKEAYYHKREISKELSSNLNELIQNEKYTKDSKELDLLKIMMSAQGALKQEKPVEVLDK